MIIFANGGDMKNEFDEAFDKFKDFLIPNMTLLYIPIAAENDDYNDKYSEFIKHLGETEYGIIDMLTDASELKDRNIRDYSAIIIDDGNPFKLINELRQSGAFDIILKAVKNNTPLFAIGAGAVILGKHIEQSEINHSTDFGDTDVEGFNLFDGRDIFVYSEGYTDEKYADESGKLLYAAKEKDRRIIALHRQTTIYKINSGLYKLNKDVSFDSVTPEGISRYPYYGKIKYELDFK